MKITLTPIGILHVPHSDMEVSSSLQGVDGVVEVYPKYADGLRGIDDFSHIVLLAYLHKIKAEDRKVLIIKFRKFLKFGFSPEELPEVGVFASDSPVRPNPIALTIVKLIKREGRFLHVSGLDLYDKTPIIDIKPYTPDRYLKEYSLPKWYEDFLIKVKKRIKINRI